MGAAKKLVLPEEQYIQDRLKDGTCVRQDFSMKVLGKPDTTYQARVEKLDVVHAKRFADHLQDGGALWPVVIFQSVVGRKVRALLADGFHRHHAYASLKRPSIPAYVVTVPDDQLEHEARLYSSMCNQLATKGRTKEDIRMAVEMLLAVPECQKWSFTKIGDHCGVSPSSVHRWSDLYFAENGINPPEKIVGINGFSYNYKGPIIGGEPRIYEDKRRHEGRTKFRTNFGKRPIYGSTRDEVREKFAEMEIEGRKNRLNLTQKRILRLLIRNGFHAGIVPLSIGPRFGHVTGIKIVSTFLTTSPETTRASLDKAIVDVRLLPHHAGVAEPRRVVVCYPEDYPVALLDLARKDGIEFLTPDELVASLGERDHPPGDEPRA